MRPKAVASAMTLTSGGAHAIVSGALKSGKDKMSSRAVIDGFSALMVAPLVFVPPQPIHAWTWLLGKQSRFWPTGMAEALVRIDSASKAKVLRDRGVVVFRNGVCGEL